MDQLTESVNFYCLPTYFDTCEMLVLVYVDEIFSRHGVPVRNVSDIGSIFLP
jgi:hypothetical protein